MKKNIRFLKNVKCRIEALPWSIWENEDIDDSQYDKKRKRLKGEVMHIQNQIRGYILAQYGEGDLLHEFSCYSFFTQGFIADTFNVENNKAWSNGKKSFLCFTDKLIDFAEAEEVVNSIDWRNNLIKWFILFVIVGLIVFLLFAETVFTDSITAIFSNEIKVKLQVLLLATMITSNLLWYKNWRDLFPITTSIIGALLGLRV
ncbi:MAG: hypothetical protein NC206_04435 [Bacteroides sp.]|nr:hypothetical protein [Roseburia sp.]MCM1346312.1 hypothetical protein [Bacteroides sp.]MCM1420799.1 hypothetical protein [Bacteroides sp.]